MPPAIEPLVGPTIDSVLGMEAKTRTDWRVLPDADKQGDDVADALNYRLNQAERHSKADYACWKPTPVRSRPGSDGLGRPESRSVRL